MHEKHVLENTHAKYKNLQYENPFFLLLSPYPNYAICKKKNIKV